MLFLQEIAYIYCPFPFLFPVSEYTLILLFGWVFLPATKEKILIAFEFRAVKLMAHFASFHLLIYSTFYGWHLQKERIHGCDTTCIFFI